MPFSLTERQCRKRPINIFGSKTLILSEAKGYYECKGNENCHLARPTYLKRITDDLLQERLRSSGAVLIEDAKLCGKTTRASQSQLFMQYLDKSASHLMAADAKPC